MRIRTFKGGVHPPENKYFTKFKIIERAPLPKQVIIPLQQHIGSPAECIVEKGMQVKTGQPLSKTSKLVSVPVHASISGTISVIENRPHPQGSKMLSVVIESDGKDEWFIPRGAPTETETRSADDLRRILQSAGIAGMGGAAFPTHVKLSPPSDRKIDTVILNGAECEPYLTSDHRLMLEKSDEILKGLLILMQVLNAEKACIAIEKNKPDAIQLFRKKTKKIRKVNVIALPVKYPQGGEKQLIKAVLNRNVPAGGLPMDVGCVVQNVGTAYAVYEAAALNKPLIERVVTVTGPAVREPKNIWTRIGTPYKDLIEFCGGTSAPAFKIINGGPMMGIAQYTDEVPVIKGTSGILVLDHATGKMPPEQACISCAFCVDICPMKLMPNRIASYVEYQNIEKAEKYGLLHCIECGSCSFICPASRRLVQYIKLGKAKVNAKRAAATAAV